MFFLQLADDGQVLEDDGLSLRQLTSTRPKAEGIVKETSTCLQPVQLKMFQMTNYPETAMEQLPEIKVEIDLENNEISFEGDAKTVLSGYRNLVEALSKLSVNRIDNKREEHIELYRRENVIEYINDKLEAQNIVCAWEVKGQMIVICSLEENIAACTKLIDESVTEVKFPISRESSATLITQEWEKGVKLIQAETDVVCKVFSDKTSTNVTVVATDKEGSGIVGRIKSFLENQLDRKSEYFNSTTQTFSPRFKQLYDLNSTLANTLIDQITEGLSRFYHVTVKKECIQGSRFDGWVTYHQYTINGTRDGRTHMKKQIAELNILF